VIELTKEQKGKIKRLLKLDLIEENQNPIFDERLALKIAVREDIVVHWKDNGVFYIISVAGEKRPQKVRHHEAGEYVVDAILSNLDPIRLTEDKAPERPLQYESLSLKELGSLLKKRGLGPYGKLSKEERIQRLEHEDSVS